MMATGLAKPLAADTIRRALDIFQIQADDHQVSAIQRYMAMLLQWNDKLNLTAIRDPLEILHRHFCESMFGAVSVPIEIGRLADIGAGPGFPGLPLKILRPKLELFLVESNLKKGTFLAEVIRELELTNAKVLIGRYEDLAEDLAPVDFLCSRALGDYPSFLKWAASESLAARQLVLWIGGRDLEELRKSPDWEWREPIPVPRSLQRYLLVGTKKERNVGATTNHENKQ